MLNNKNILVLTILIFCSPVLFAQFNDTLEFKIIEIEGTRVTTEEPYKKQQIDSVILNRYATTSISDLLQNETPVFIKSYGQGAVSSISFRGTGSSHTQLFWNGIPINSPVLGMNDVSLLPAAFSNDVELHYGLSSLVDGTGGLGGAIQLNNQVNWKDSFNLFTSINTGSYGLLSFDFKLSVVFNELSVQSGFLLSKTENDFEYRNLSTSEKLVEKQQNSESKQYGWFQNFYYKINNKNQLSLKYNFFDSDRNLPKLITQTVSDENLKDKSFKSVLEWTHVSASSLLSAQVGFWREVFIYEFPTNDISSNYHANNWVANVNYKKQLKYSYKLNLVYNGGYTVANNKYYPEPIQWMRNAMMLSLSKSINDKLFINGLIREELIGQKWSPILPSLGFKYQVLPVFGVKGNVAKSYRFPSFNDLYWDNGRTKGNPDLVPEEGWSSEVGLDYTKKGEKSELKTELTGYYSNINNWIIWLPDEVLGTFWTPQNKKKVKNQGIELIERYSYKHNDFQFILRGVYALSSSKSVEGEAANQLLYVPYNQYKLRGSFGYKSLNISYNHVYTDRRYITTDNNWYMPDYQLGHLTVSAARKIKKSTIRLEFKINNIWNKEYQSIAWRPMVGRNYEIKLSYQFKK